MRAGAIESGADCELASIRDVDTATLHQYDLVGLGTPVFYYQEPANVRQFIADLEQTQVLNLGRTVETAEQIETLLRAGKVSIGVFIPADFERRVMDTGRPAAHLLVDGVDPTIVGVANQIRNMPVRFDAAMPETERASTFEVRPYYNPERRSAVFVIPRLIGIILTLTMMLFTAVAVVREREHGNLELLINTPVSTTQLMIGKIIPYIIIGLIQLTIVLGLGKFVFNVPIRGDISQIFLASLLFISASLTLGLIISTVAKSQLQSMQMTVFILLPSILLSGFMFPYSSSFAIPPNLSLM